MPPRPDVSIVMPVWRPRADWLRAAIDSALGQTGCDVEVVVVDDGNDEPVAQLVGTIDDERLRVLRIEHAGASAARNAGIAAARGPHLRFADADDVLVADGTAVLLRAAGDGAIAHGGTLVCDEELRPERVIASDVNGDAVAACLLGRFDVRHVSMLFPADVVAAAGPWDPTLRVGEDWDFVLRCLEHAPVVAVDAVVTHYRRHPASATRGPSARADARHGQRRVLEKHADRHPGAQGRPLRRQAWATFHEAWARRAVAERTWRGFVPDALALTRLAPRAAFGVWRAAAGALSRRTPVGQQ